VKPKGDGPVTAQLGKGVAGVAEAMAAAGAEIDGVLQNLLPEPNGPEGRLAEAMRYSVLAPGKRFRPILALAAAELFAVPRRAALRVAVAIEFAHTYSLVHDDLPCMDDDDMRRGQPTLHKQFDEATAVLAGDALLPLAFEILAHPETHAEADVRLELMRALAEAAGPRGMVGGQMIDLMVEHKPADIGTITRMQQLKTGALIAFACEAGAVLGKAPNAARQALRAYARDLGLAFQIVDDLLDVEGSEEATGKRVGKDAGLGKATFVALLGTDRARTQAAMLADQAVAHLEMFGERGAFLRRLASFVVQRSH
jgi:farnesyl diphosphate synthase